jgi:hypothetical protein
VSEKTADRTAGRASTETVLFGLVGVVKADNRTSGLAKNNGVTCIDKTTNREETNTEIGYIERSNS